MYKRVKLSAIQEGAMFIVFAKCSWGYVYSKRVRLFRTLEYLGCITFVLLSFVHPPRQQKFALTSNGILMLGEPIKCDQNYKSPSVLVESFPRHLLIKRLL